MAGNHGDATATTSRDEYIEEEYGDAHKDLFFVNEFLASAVHAMNTGKTDDEICQSFVLFYDDESTKAARSTLGTLTELPKRTARKNKSTATKVKEVAEIIEALRKFDFQGKGIQFVAIDLNMTCRVHSGLGDEIQMRDELQRMKTRLSTVEELCNVVNDLSTKIDNLSQNVNKPNSAATYTAAVKKGSNKKSEAPSEIHCPRNDKQKLINPIMVSTPKDGNMPQWPGHSIDNYATTADMDKEWSIVRKRRNRNSPVTGSAENELIKPSECKPLNLFITRCGGKRQLKS
ncbi:unnamed protein product [Orchesella dallaii]|uniref:Uncharacterized protein n=1 Tax=Orchesella dallaii TaxID=48710 RepID=A0ABP1Q0P9_9HEXA